jgi:hypothetical protein
MAAIAKLLCLGGRTTKCNNLFVVGLPKNAKTNMATATVVDILANKTFTGTFIGGYLNKLTRCNSVKYFCIY